MIADLISGSTFQSSDMGKALMLDGVAASHSFVLESRVKGVFHSTPTSVKFRVPTKAAALQAKGLIVKYRFLVSVLLLAGLFIYTVARPSKSSAGKGSKRPRIKISY